MNSYTLSTGLLNIDPDSPWPANPRPIIIIYTLFLLFWLCAFASGTVATILKNRNFYFLACLGLLVCGILLLIFGTISVHARGQELMEVAIVKRLKPDDIDREEMYKWIINVQNTVRKILRT
jgi:hypothetical protein